MSYECKTCIIDHIAASGPQDMAELRRECNTQATDYTPANFVLAIGELCGEGRIVAEVIGEDTKPVAYYDFPESYYTCS